MLCFMTTPRGPALGKDKVRQDSSDDGSVWEAPVPENGQKATLVQLLRVPCSPNSPFCSLPIRLTTDEKSSGHIWVSFPGPKAKAAGGDMELCRVASELWKTSIPCMAVKAFQPTHTHRLGHSRLWSR